MESNFIVWIPKKDDDLTEDSKVPLRQDEDSPSTQLNNGVTVDFGKEKEIQREDLPGYKMKGLVYGVDDRPSLQIAIICALQQVFSNIDGSIVMSFIIHKFICGGDNNLLLAQLMATTMFMCGLCTIVMTTFGVRLPVFQGSTGAYLAPLIGMMSTDKWRCPIISSSGVIGDSLLNSTLLNDTFSGVTGSEMEPWRERLLVLSGSIMVANCVQFLLGATGIIGVFMSYVSPLTITAYLCTVVTSLAGIVVDVSKPCWGIALFTMGLIVLFNIILGNVNVPLPSWSPGKGFAFKDYPIFKFFSFFFTLGIAWILSGILTAAGFFTDDQTSDGFRARTDFRASVLTESPILYFPYPFQFGIPGISAGAVGAMMAAIVASMLDSCGDYIAYARTMGYPLPPKHAVNRGIAMEGLATVISGSMGTCHGTSSYLKAVGVMIMSGVGSRFVMQLAGVILMLMAILGKVGAAFCLIPEPIIGGLATISLGAVFEITAEFWRVIQD